MARQQHQQQDILSILAPEVMLNVLSFMPLTEVYRIRSVCKVWQAMAEEYIYMSIRASRSTVNIKIGDKTRNVCIRLIPHSYDSQNRIVEFHPVPSPSTPLVPMTVDPSNPWSTCHRHMQIHFSQWAQSENRHSPLIAAASSPQNTTITPAEKALIRFHIDYNPACERMYELPQWGNGNNSNPSGEHFVGDKGLILSMSYVQRPTEHSSPPSSPYYYGYPTHTASVPSSSLPPHIKIRWLRVTLSWILSGMKPEIAPTQIYPHRYAQLGHALARHGCFKYDPLSEPILAHIVHHHEDENQDMYDYQTRPASPASSISSTQSASYPHQFPTVCDMQQQQQQQLESGLSMDNNDNKKYLSPELLEYVQVHTHECHTRLSRLQHVLEGAGVDARVLWKYTFAKHFVVGNGSLLGEEDVVRRIQDSEEEWRMKRISLFRRLGSMTVY